MKQKDRMIVLDMLLENLGMDKAVELGDLADWKASIVDLEKTKKLQNQLYFKLFMEK